MTVGELIERLSNFHERTPVFVNDTEWGTRPVENVWLDPKDWRGIEVVVIESDL